MTPFHRVDMESFLVEDVILTLGNLRGSLDWLAECGASDPALIRAGFLRLGRQIDLLEDRARSLQRSLASAAGACAPEGPPGPNGNDDAAVAGPLPEFRSRRPGVRPVPAALPAGVWPDAL